MEEIKCIMKDCYKISKFIKAENIKAILYFHNFIVSLREVCFEPENLEYFQMIIISSSNFLGIRYSLRFN